MSPGSVKHLRNGQKTSETHLTSLWFCRKLGWCISVLRRKAISCGAKCSIYYIHTAKDLWRGKSFQNFILGYTPATNSQIVLGSLFTKVPYKSSLNSLCDRGPPPNICPSDITAGHGKRGVGCWGLPGVKPSSPTARCYMDIYVNMKIGDPSVHDW